MYLLQRLDRWTILTFGFMMALVQEQTEPSLRWTTLPIVGSPLQAFWLFWGLPRGDGLLEICQLHPSEILYI